MEYPIKDFNLSKLFQKRMMLDRNKQDENGLIGDLDNH